MKEFFKIREQVLLRLVKSRHFSFSAKFICLLLTGLLFINISIGRGYNNLNTLSPPSFFKTLDETEGQGGNYANNQQGRKQVIKTLIKSLKNMSFADTTLKPTRKSIEDMVKLLLRKIGSGLKNGDKVLEIGSGSGILTISLALFSNYKEFKDTKFVATDINPAAVSDTKNNSRLLKVKVDTRLGELFLPMRRGEKFDLVFWNPPWYVERKGQGKKQNLELAMVDEGYSSLKQFLREVFTYLTPQGRVYLIFPDEFVSQVSPGYSFERIGSYIVGKSTTRIGFYEVTKIEGEIPLLDSVIKLPQIFQQAA